MIHTSPFKESDNMGTKKLSQDEYIRLADEMQFQDINGNMAFDFSTTTKVLPSDDQYMVLSINNLKSISYLFFTAEDVKAMIDKLNGIIKEIHEN